jgi:hypothetical protein
VCFPLCNQVMCVAGSCESISMFMGCVLLSATRLAAMVFELACNSSVLVLKDWVLLRAVRLAAVKCKLAGWFRYAECVNVFRCTLKLSLSHNSCTSAIHTMSPLL